MRTDLDILCALGRAPRPAAAVSRTRTREAVFDELRRATRGGPADYSGITYERIDAEDGVFWPCPAIGSSGHAAAVRRALSHADGRARFHAVSHRSPAEERDDEYPLYLTTGRVLAHYQSGTQTRRVRALQAIAAEPFAEMHPATARALGVADGDRVVLTTRRGVGDVHRRSSTPTIREDTVFVPFHWGGEQSANRLTNAALDPDEPHARVQGLRGADRSADP